MWWCQTVISRVVRRGHCVSRSHRRSRVHPSLVSSSSLKRRHWERCHVQRYLPENIENLDKVTAQKLKKEQEKVKTQDANKPQDVQDLTKEITAIQEEIDKLNSMLEIWQKKPKPGQSALLEWNQGSHSAVLSLAGTHLKVWGDQFGKITDTVKITLALQNVKGNLAQSLNVSISDSTTWPHVHALLINYFNNAVPVDLKPIYQFDQSEKTEINSFKKGKGKGQKSKGQKGNGSKGSSSLQNPKGKSKGKGKTKSKGKSQWTTWSWGQNQQNANWNQSQKGQKGSKSGKGNQLAQFAEKQDILQISAGGIEIKKDGTLKDQHHSSKEARDLSTSKEVYNIHQHPQDQPIQSLPPDQLRGFRDLRPQAQQQQYQNLSQAPTQCGSIATVLSSSDQVGGFSGQRLNINYLSDSRDLDSGIMGQEICASFPYSIDSGLPSHLQDPWAALIDSGAVTSIAPSSFAPHVLITPHSGQLVNVNGGEIKIKCQKKVVYVTHMVVMHITFLIVEEVLNPIIGLDALHQNSVQFHLFQTGKAYLQQKSQKAVLHYHKHHYYTSGLVLSGYVKSSFLKWDDPQYTIFDPQSTS